MRHQIQAKKLIPLDQIASYKQSRHQTQFQACTQVNQIFLKANGKISCSCMSHPRVKSLEC